MVPVLDKQPRSVVLFDGVCALCNRVVEWIIAHDRREIFFFAPLQGKTAKSIKARHPEVHFVLSPPESIILVENYGEPNEKVHFTTNAVFAIIEKMEFPVRWLTLFRILPFRIREWGYRLIATHRYRWFGKLEQCRLPNPSEKTRFLP
ncbi:MAG: DUF393 domain-containing protein [Calditrichaeota bacterium]|nr:MAG: DUF393 domain-containing protein [Calditrichota bacterium]